jgi:O-acetyl-ADP-ribose deacetylase
MQLIIRRGSFLNEDVDALIIPANATGTLLGEILDEVKAVGGEEIEEASIAEAPVPVGEAIATTAGLLRCKAIIHAPIMDYPDGKCDEHMVKCAVEAGLELAEVNRFSRIALPLRWTISTALASETVMAALLAHPAVFIQEVILEDHEEALVAAWQAELKRLSEKV